MNAQNLKSLVRLGIPYEDAYAQCWRDLRLSEQTKKTPVVTDTNTAKQNAKMGGRPRYGETKDQARNRRGIKFK